MGTDTGRIDMPSCGNSQAWVGPATDETRAWRIGRTAGDYRAPYGQPGGGSVPSVTAPESRSAAAEQPVTATTAEPDDALSGRAPS